MNDVVKRANEPDVVETALWRDYMRGVSHKHETGLSKKIPQYVKFYEGEQWPRATAATKNFPRPVVNIVKMICRNKKAAILSGKLRIVYHAADGRGDVEKFNRFSDYIAREIGQDEADRRAMQDGVVKGSYFYHYYWDADARGKLGTRRGGVRVEIIDPLDIYFENPAQTDEQKQRWILIASRQSVASVRARADKNIDPGRILPDRNEEERYGVVEQDGDALCTVLTRYFRRGDEVWCEVGVRGTMVNMPFRMTPDVAGAMQKITAACTKRGNESLPGDEEDEVRYDAPNNTLPDMVEKEKDEMTRSGSGRNDGSSRTPAPTGVGEAYGVGRNDGSGRNDRSSRTPTPTGLGEAYGPSGRPAPTGVGEMARGKGARAALYPIVAGQYEHRQGSIYGLGEVEGLIPNQKAINLNLAMMLLHAQQMAWGKYVVYEGALGDQVITNEPGQVLVNHLGIPSAIQQMPGTAQNGAPMQLIESITSLTRSVTGSSELMTGETVSASMSGAAIAQLQSQAQMPTEELRNAFRSVKEKQGKVLAQFYKLYYRDAEFSYEERPEYEQTANGQAVDPQLRTVVQRFNGTEYADTEFEVVCETVTGTGASAAGDINILDVLFAKGQISLRTYIEAYPDDAMSNKTKILEGIERDRADELGAMQQQLQTVSAQLQESAQLIEQQRTTVELAVSAIRENNRLKGELVALAQSSTQAIEAANAQIEAGNREIASGRQEIQRSQAEAAESYADAAMFARHIAAVDPDERSRGVRPTPQGIGGQTHGMSEM